MNVDKKYHSISDTQMEHQEIQQNLILYIKFKFEIGFNYPTLIKHYYIQ